MFMPSCRNIPFMRVLIRNYLCLIDMRSGEVDSVWVVCAGHRDWRGTHPELAEARRRSLRGERVELRHQVCAWQLNACRKVWLYA